MAFGILISDVVVFYILNLIAQILPSKRDRLCQFNKYLECVYATTRCSLPLEYIIYTSISMKCEMTVQIRIFFFIVNKPQNE